jgi:hypothetical protein
MEKSRADALIMQHHYSHSPVWASHTHFGVFVNDSLCGVLQFGPGMNPASGDRVIPGMEWCELNRMWLSDDRPVQQLATGALALACRILRSRRPKLGWLQTFADERSGVGAVYQAASFLYVGSHETTFYLLDGEWFHKSLLGRAETDGRGWGSGPKAARIRGRESEAIPHVFRQHRYIKCFTKQARKGLLLPVLSYPKAAR